MIGREREKKELLDLYDSNRCELVAVYGRRRVGKTYLVEEVFGNDFTFRHAGLSPVDHEKKGFLKAQLEQFYFSLLKHGMKAKKKPSSWMEAFYYLECFLEEHDDGNRQLLFIDELPWLDTPRSGFLTAFEGFWNNWGCRRKNLMLIVCGSASSWILDNLINNHGGLYNRITYEIKLSPFNLNECEKFYLDQGLDMSRYDMVTSYMVLGGIPYYMGYFKRQNSLAQNIDLLFFDSNAKLRDEYNRLFDSIFDRPEIMKSIVRTLSTRRIGLKRSELLKKLKMKEGEVFSKCLNALVTSDFVLKYIPFGEKANECYYKLIDPFCLFWLHFVEGKNINDTGFWQKNLTSQPVVTWQGLAFENICFNHVPQIKKALGILGVMANYSAWHIKDQKNGGVQIDMLLSRNDHIINMCEMKFYGGDYTVESNDYKSILKRKEALLEQTDKKTAVHSTLITTFGLEQNKYSSVFTNIITLNDLFSEL